MAAIATELPVLPDPAQRPTITVPEAGALFGLGERASYKAVERGEIPAIRVGRALKVPTARLVEVLAASPDFVTQIEQAATDLEAAAAEMTELERRVTTIRTRFEQQAMALRGVLAHHNH